MSFSPERLLSVLGGLPRPGSYWVAYSGGLDSSVLLHALAALRPVLAAPLQAVHVHHGLHPDADAWEAHCRATCQRLGVACAVQRIVQAPARGCSLEAWAREARYAAFDRELPPRALLLTAHQGDDQAETVLLQLLRGAGPAGLAGAAALSARGDGWLARPLLDWDRTALADYARRTGIAWLEDPSNAEIAFDRNLLRHQVLPGLRARWPGLNATLARSAAHCAEAQRVLDEVAAELFAATPDNGPYRLSAAQLLALPPHRQHLLLRHWLRRSQLPLPDANRLHRLVSEVAAARADAAPRVAWPGAEVRRFQGCLRAMPPLPPLPGGAELPWNDARLELALPSGLGRLVMGSAGTLALPAATVRAGPLVVRFRSRVPGTIPAGRRGRRSYKRLCQEWGVPPWLRGRVPLLYCGDHLAAVGDYGACEPFAVASGQARLWLRWERPAYLR